MVVLNSTKGKCEPSCFLNASAHHVPLSQLRVLQWELPSSASASPGANGTLVHDSLR